MRPADPEASGACGSSVGENAAVSIPGSNESRSQYRFSPAACAVVALAGRGANTTNEKPLAFFHAEADFREPRYFNGYEVPGVLDGWQTAKDRKSTRKRQSLLSIRRSS